MLSTGKLYTPTQLRALKEPNYYRMYREDFMETLAQQNMDPLDICMILETVGVL